jgi:formate C-acetyltransferase
MTLTIEDEDYFVGNKAKTFCGYSGAMWPLMIDIEHEWTLKEDGLWHNPEGQEVRIAISQEDIDTIRKLAPTLAEGQSRAGDAWMPDGAQEFFDLMACDYRRPGRPGNLVSPGHLTPGWQKIINVGYEAIRKQAQDFLDQHKGNIMGDNMKRYIFYKAAALCCEAATILVKRYADLCAEKAAETKDPDRKAELLKMADSLEWISKYPARNFWEACQAVLLYQLFLMTMGGFPAPLSGASTNTLAPAQERP